MLQSISKLQHLLPHYLLSKLAHKLASCNNKIIKNLIIKLFIKIYKINLAENIIKSPEGYDTFNSFFTRKLAPGARNISPNDAIVSPVDGNVLTLGQIEPDKLFQAKNKYYSLASLLGESDNSQELCQLFQNGCYITQYLSPNDYHRVHIPCDGILEKMIYVPGKLFSVSPASCSSIDQIFARNERVINIFKTENGHMAVILVGAMLVGSMATSWHGLITPPHGLNNHNKIKTWDYNNQNIKLNKSDELGYFAMGSTVIVLFSDKLDLNNDLINKHVKFGETLI